MAAKITQLGFNISVPDKDAFGGKPFKNANELGVLMNKVIQKHAPRFDVTENFTIDQVWRARGTTRRGEPVLADCLKPGGLALYYSEADFVLVFNAQHLADLALTEDQWEALVFEQLCKIGANENTGTAELLPYDFAGFNASLEAYGAWRTDLQRMANQIQPGLFVVEDKAEGEEPDAEDAPPPAETLPTHDLAADAMADAGWTIPPNGHPRVDEASDAAAEQNFAAARGGRGRSGAE